MGWFRKLFGGGDEKSTDTKKTMPSQTIARIVIFKAGSRPGNEGWYIQHVCESIGLSLTSLEGANLDIRYVDSTNLNQAYIIGFALASGHDASQCTLTPFSDRDGGKGMVLKVKK